MIGQRTDSTFSYVTITGVIRPFRIQSLDSPDVHLKHSIRDYFPYTKMYTKHILKISHSWLRARFFGHILIKYILHFSPLNVLKGPS